MDSEGLVILVPSTLGLPGSPRGRGDREVPPPGPRRAPDTPTSGLRLLSVTEQAPCCGDDALSRRSGSTSSVRRGQPRHARRRFRWQQDKDDKVADYGRPRELST